MKKILSALILVSLVLPALVLAVEPTKPIEGGLTWATLRTNILNVVWIILAVIAIIFFVMAGITFLTAGGDPEKIAKARQAFLWGAIGIAVAVIGYSIVAIVQNLVTP